MQESDFVEIVVFEEEHDYSVMRIETSPRYHNLWLTLSGATPLDIERIDAIIGSLEKAKAFLNS